jgi:hypothetical protein
MADSTIRNIIIKGAAVDDFHKSKGTRKRRSPATKYQSGGDAPPGQPITTNQNIKNARVMINAVGKTFQNGGSSEAGAAAQTSVAAKTDIQLVSAPGTIPQMPNPASPAVKASLEAGTAIIPVTPVAATVQAGGAKKVILGQKKTKKAKLLLAPPSGKRKVTSVAKTRKIRVALSGLKKRLTKQKTIAKDSREKPIAEVRTLLEGAKLIKPVADGKKGPPDNVLRDIYKDYLLLRNRAL